MKKKLPWYKRNPKDYLAATRELTPEERGVYNDLIELMYLRDRPIPDDPRFIAGFVGVSVRRWNVIRQSLIDADKITLRGDYISNQRFEKERGDQEAFREAAQSWGHLGGKKRAAKAKRDRQGQFAFSGAKSDENRRNPRVPSKGPLGEDNERQEKTGHAQEFQSLKPDIPLEELDDSFLRANPRSRTLSPDYPDFSADFGAGKNDENGSFPPSSSKPARARPEGRELRDSSVESLHEGGSGGKRAAARKKAANAVQLPTRWQAPELTEQLAQMTQDWPAGMLERETERFRDHALAQGRTAKDWDAAHRNWLRKADDDFRKQQQRGTRNKGWAAVGNRIAGQAH